jgi:hypothetical protein
MKLLNKYADFSKTIANPVSHAISGLFSLNLTSEVVWVEFDGDINAFGFDDASEAQFHGRYGKMNLDLSVITDIVSAFRRAAVDFSGDETLPSNISQTTAKKILENASIIFHPDFQKYVTMFNLTGDIHVILKNLPN